MLQGDGISLVRFDDTAQTLMPVTDVGPPVFGGGRIAAIGHINGPEIDPAGATSIGAGVVAGKQALDAAQALGSPHYDVLAMLVLTDGEENTPPMLADVGGSITANTFAIGLGRPENISTAALNTLTQGHSGYLLVTGVLTPDQATRLDKYFLQVLAGVTNANVILDPHGVLSQGAEHRIPFARAETDYGMDVFLLSPSPGLVDFELEAPDGQRFTPGSAAALSNMQYVQTGQMGYYRLSLPADPAHAGGTHPGIWHVLLRIGRQVPGVSRGESFVIGTPVKGGITLPYDVIVHCYSNLNFHAYARQTTFEPNARVDLTATLLEYDVPVGHRAAVWADITRPDGSVFTLGLTEAEPGRFEAGFATSLTGLYTMRVRALGNTFRGTPFEREQTLTAAAYPGGDRPSQPGDGGRNFWCEVLECLLRNKVIDPQLLERLQAAGLDLKGLLECVCKRDHTDQTDQCKAQPVIRPR